MTSLPSISPLSAEYKQGLYDTPAFHTAGEAIMSFSPVSSLHQHLCAFHFYAHDRTRQIEVCPSLLLAFIAV
jgi:hypothetical protein